MKLKIRRLRPEAVLPTYAHGPDEDAGMDLRSCVNLTIAPGTTVLVPTGLALEIPSGYEAQVRPRSGLALKHSITMPNAPGTIDPGYRGELGVILHNLGTQPFEIHQGDRIAQLIIARYERVEWEESELQDSTRGQGGFGSSGR
ncbi:MAG: dUTP diphosphatase [Bryobacterales bacterium]|nr:dUTP diphosphatase [Bryobacterales bacterium]